MLMGQMALVLAAAFAGAALYINIAATLAFAWALN